MNPGINDSYKQDEIDANQWKERFEREGREVFDQRQKIVESLDILPGMAIADVGSGTGLFTPLLAKATGPGGKVYALDIVPEFLETVEQRMKEQGIENVQTILCDDKLTELPENSIDLAFICDTYHHFEYPLNAMNSIWDALRAGGAVILVDFKRETGESSDWVMNHVRAGKEVFTSEIESAGFRKETEWDFLNDNYMIRFRKKTL